MRDQRSVSGSLSNRKQEKHRGGWGIRTNSPKSYLVKFSGGNFFGLISSFSGRATEVRSQKTVLTSLESSRRPLTAWNTLGYCLHD